MSLLIKETMLSPEFGDVILNCKYNPNKKETQTTTVSRVRFYQLSLILTVLLHAS